MEQLGHATLKLLGDENRTSGRVRHRLALDHPAGCRN